MLLQALSHRSLVRSVLVAVLLPSFLFPTLSQTRAPQERLTVAVLDFAGRGVKEDEAASLSDVFQGVLVQSQQFTVVDRNRIKAILDEIGFQQSEACSQVECIVQVGKILKVERMFAGTIGRVGRRFTINIQVIDVATAQIVSSKPRQHDGAIEDLAGDIIPEIAQEMIEDLTGRRLATGVRTTGGGASWLLWVGGAVLVGGGAAAAVILTQKKEGDGNGGTEGRKSLPSGPALP